MNASHFDALIVGAGLSGIGTACHFAQKCPGKRLAILERRERIGGTWDLFRYPGIRSDSDMATFGYRFNPWNSPKVLADGATIRQYIQDTATKFSVVDRVHFGLKVVSADWSSAQRRWNLTALHETSGQSRLYSCNYLVSCTGYYNYDDGFRPQFPGEDNFKGIVIHPQHWPKDLDYAGKRVVVIGSGATAITLVPAMARTAGRVTMLQRSPSYVFSIPAHDHLTAALARVLPQSWTYGLVRRRNLWWQRGMYLACRRWPRLMRRMLLSMVRKHLGADFDMRHFTPRYMPWDERVCVVPDADLFRALREGTAAIETDQIEHFSERGIVLKSGKELLADIIIVATGLNLQMLGGAELSVDGVSRPLSEQMTYKGVLLESVPNFAWIFGYINASWTLKVDIAADYLCRLLNFMDAHRLAVVTPQDDAGNLTDAGIIDSLKAGYVQRHKHHAPRQGRTYPWRVMMHYGRDRKMLRGPIEDRHLRFVADEPDVASKGPRSHVPA
jgi:monooxygenase